MNKHVGKEIETQIDEKIIEYLAQMTLKEKVWYVSGTWDPIRNQIRHRRAYGPVPDESTGCKRLGLPTVKFCDGPRGVVPGESTCFPVTMARGASFDRNLERRVGEAMGKEARAAGANYFGGVCINLLRHPAWGRAQETYGENPFHVGEMGAALTAGVQRHNVIACLKHYAVNSIENNRFNVDVHIDERSLREVYLPHFKKAIDAGAASVMGAYNRCNGDHCCEHKHLLTDILRDDWGFEGFTITDYLYGLRDTVKGIKAGMDLEMPMPVRYRQKLLEAVTNGMVPEELIDASVKRILKTLLMFERSPDPMEYPPELKASAEHRELAREAAEKSMVLLKNTGSVLPFGEKPRMVLLLGRLAERENTGDHGSSRVYPSSVVTALQGIRTFLGEGTEVLHENGDDIDRAKQLAEKADCVIIVAGYDFNDEGEFMVPDDGGAASVETIARGYKNQGMLLKSLFIRLAMRFQKRRFTTEEGEPVGGDRRSLSLKPTDLGLINAVGPVNKNTAVVLVGGSMIMIREWEESVPAILYGWYAGMEGGTALARVLFGEVNPSGKLPFVIPRDERHLPYFSSTDDEIEYGLYHGYTLLEKEGHTPAYPFGFGLSYTTFSYSDLRVERTKPADVSASAGAGMVTVGVTVENTGHRDGEEVVQVYVGMKNSAIDRQKKLLKGFEKVFIPAGEKRRVEISVPANDLRYYSVDEKRWIFEPGRYQFYAGSSSAEEHLLVEEISLS